MRTIAGLVFLSLAFCASARAADIAVALTDDVIEVDAGFAGARLTLFGAVTGVEDPENAIDVIAVIRGPETRFRVRRLERNRFIWAPGEAHEISAAPGLYLTAATRRITDIAPLPDQASFRLGTNFLLFDDGRTEDTEGIRARDREFEEAFVDGVEEKGLYSDRIDAVSFKKGGLFAINADLPANTPVGEYLVSVHLYRDGERLGSDSATLVVNKVGIERGIYNLAHERPISYGILCVALSLLAGWIAAFAFRK